jgi:hypothetical protein
VDANVQRPDQWSFAASSHYPSVTLRDAEVRLFESSIVNDTYRLRISLPITYAGGERSYPVAHLSDGNELFPVLRAISDGLSGGLEIRCLLRLWPTLSRGLSLSYVAAPRRMDLVETAVPSRGDRKDEVL